MSLELYCELTPVKPCYKEMKDGQPFAYGRFYGNNCHVGWGIRARLKEDIMEPNNERVFFYRYYKAGNIMQNVPRFLRRRSWTRGGDLWKFTRQQTASIVLINRFKERRAFEIHFELRANNSVQFFLGPITNIRFVREVPDCQRTNLERIGPFRLGHDEWMFVIVRPTFRLPESAVGKLERELEDEEKYLWMEFYRANVYVHHGESV